MGAKKCIFRPLFLSTFTDDKGDKGLPVLKYPFNAKPNEFKDTSLGFPNNNYTKPVFDDRVMVMSFGFC